MPGCEGPIGPDSCLTFVVRQVWSSFAHSGARYKQCKSKDRANCPTATANRKYLYRNAKYAGVTKHASIKSMHQRALKQQVPLTAELALWETQV